MDACTMVTWVLALMMLGTSGRERRRQDHCAMVTALPSSNSSVYNLLSMIGR